jgi:hypothetical protein
VAEELTKSIWGKLQDWRGITDHTRGKVGKKNVYFHIQIIPERKSKKDKCKIESQNC